MSAQKLLAEADKLLAKGKLPEAIEKLQAALKAEPLNQLVATKLANALVENGDTAAATKVYVSLAARLSDAGKSQVAIAIYKQAIELSPHDIDLKVKFATECEAVGKLGDAQAQGQVALQYYLTRKKFFDASNLMPMLARIQNKDERIKRQWVEVMIYAQAEQKLVHLLVAFCGPPGLASQEFPVGGEPTALSADLYEGLKRLVTFFPRDPKVAYAVAWAAYRRENFSDCYHYLRESIRREPDFTLATLLFARLLAEKQKLNEALFVYKYMKERQPNDKSTDMVTLNRLVEAFVEKNGWISFSDGMGMDDLDPAGFVRAFSPAAPAQTAGSAPGASASAQPAPGSPAPGMPPPRPTARDTLGAVPSEPPPAEIELSAESVPAEIQFTDAMARDAIAALVGMEIPPAKPAAPAAAPPAAPESASPPAPIPSAEPAAFVPAPVVFTPAPTLVSPAQPAASAPVASAPEPGPIAVALPSAEEMDEPSRLLAPHLAMEPAAPTPAPVVFAPAPSPSPAPSPAPVPVLTAAIEPEPDPLGLRASEVSQAPEEEGTIVAPLRAPSPGGFNPLEGLEVAAADGGSEKAGAASEGEARTELFSPMDILAASNLMGSDPDDIKTQLVDRSLLQAEPEAVSMEPEPAPAAPDWEGAREAPAAAGAPLPGFVPIPDFAPVSGGESPAAPSLEAVDLGDDLLDGPTRMIAVEAQPESTHEMLAEVAREISSKSEALQDPDLFFRRAERYIGKRNFYLARKALRHARALGADEERVKARLSDIRKMEMPDGLYHRVSSDSERRELAQDVIARLETEFDLGGVGQTGVTPELEQRLDEQLAEALREADPRTMMDFGVGLHEMGLFRQAEEVFGRIINESPAHSFDAYYLAAEAKFSREDYAGAVSILRKLSGEAGKSEIDKIQIYYALGELFEKMKRPESREFFQKVAAIDANYRNVRHKLEGKES